LRRAYEGQHGHLLQHGDEQMPALVQERAEIGILEQLDLKGVGVRSVKGPKRCGCRAFEKWQPGGKNIAARGLVENSALGLDYIVALEYINS
jgi:hypothetical protein